MSELRSVLETLEAEDLGSVSDAGLETDLAELQRASERLELERLRRLAELDRRKPWQVDGHLSTTGWLASRLRLAHGAAAADVRLARALERMPAVRREAASGEISGSALRVLASAREADPDAFSEAERILVDAARIHSVRDLGRAVAHWRQAVESRRSAARGGEDPWFERRRLHASATVFGMVRIDGDLDPETGETVLTALRSVLDAERRGVGGDGDRRTPAQRRADALGEICRRWLDAGNAGSIRGERPHVTVTMDLGALRGLEQALAEFDHVGAADPATSRDSPAMPRSRASSSGGPASRSTSGVERRSCRHRCGGPLPSGTGAAGSRAATARRPGATRTTSGTGRTEAPPRSPTWRSCAGATTGWSTEADSGSMARARS